jgi:hypothetical protein
METAIAFAAGMLLTLIALALEDWTRLSKQSNASPLNEEKYGGGEDVLSNRRKKPGIGVAMVGVIPATAANAISALCWQGGEQAARMRHPQYHSPLC